MDLPSGSYADMPYDTSDDAPRLCGRSAATLLLPLLPRLSGRSLPRLPGRLLPLLPRLLGRLFPPDICGARTRVSAFRGALPTRGVEVLKNTTSKIKWTSSIAHA